MFTFLHYNKSNKWTKLPELGWGIFLVMAEENILVENKENVEFLNILSLGVYSQQNAKCNICSNICIWEANDIRVLYYEVINLPFHSKKISRNCAKMLKLLIIFKEHLSRAQRMLLYIHLHAAGHWRCSRHNSIVGSVTNFPFHSIRICTNESLCLLQQPLAGVNIVCSVLCLWMPIEVVHL